MLMGQLELAARLLRTYERYAVPITNTVPSALVIPIGLCPSVDETRLVGAPLGPKLRKLVVMLIAA